MELQQYKSWVLEFRNHSIHKGALLRTNMYEEDNSMHNPDVERHEQTFEIRVEQAKRQEDTPCGATALRNFF